MRGSPIFRTLLVALALALVATGLASLSRRPPPAPPAPEQPVPGELQSTPFFLTLSHPAREVRIESAGTSVDGSGPELEQRGTLELDLAHPAIFLTVRWQDPEARPRFAKLRLEPGGRSGLSHTFDAIGDLEDVWEPELQAE